MTLWNAAKYVFSVAQVACMHVSHSSGEVEHKHNIK